MSEICPVIHTEQVKRLSQMCVVFWRLELSLNGC